MLLACVTNNSAKNIFKTKLADKYDQDGLHIGEEQSNLNKPLALLSTVIWTLLFSMTFLYKMLLNQHLVNLRMYRYVQLKCKLLTLGYSLSILCRNYLHVFKIKDWKLEVMHYQ